MTWISVKDRLPEEDGPVLIHCPSADEKKPFLSTAWYNPADAPDGWSLIAYMWIPAITHWMPWPDPPEEEEPWPRPECDGCERFESICKLDVPPLNESGICQGTTELRRQPAPAEPTVAMLDYLRKVSGCSPDVGLETWLKTLYQNWEEHNDMKAELILLREFVQAVANGAVGNFATKRGFTKLPRGSSANLTYYIEVANEVLTRSTKQVAKP